VNWKTHQQVQREAATFVRRARQLGAVVDTDNDICSLLGSVSFAARLGRQARGFDAKRPRLPNPHGNPAKEYNAGAFDDDDALTALRARIDTALSKNSEPGEHRTFLVRLRSLLDAYLKRGADSARLHGRAMRDMETAPSRNAFRAWEDGATPADREYLQRSRAQAARAADRRVPVPFLGKSPMPGSDMERLELQAAESFALI